MTARSFAAAAVLFIAGAATGALLPRAIPAAQANPQGLDLQKLAANPQFAHAVDQVMQSRVYKSQAFRYAVENSVRGAQPARPQTSPGFEYELRNAIRNCRVSGEFIRC